MTIHGVEGGAVTMTDVEGEEDTDTTLSFEAKLICCIYIAKVSKGLRWRWL